MTFLDDKALIKPTIEKLDFLQVSDFAPDLIVSYGYRHIIPEKIYSNFRTINLHISYLPWNRGSDPNFWSFKENTPKGVTIHEVDKGLDTGDIIFQKRVKFPKDCDTLAKTYNFLKEEIEELFINNWLSLKKADYTKKCQNLKGGTYHRSSNFKIYKDQLLNGWETNVGEIKCLRDPT